MCHRAGSAALAVLMVQVPGTMETTGTTGTGACLSSQALKTSPSPGKISRASSANTAAR